MFSEILVTLGMAKRKDTVVSQDVVIFEHNETPGASCTEALDFMEGEQSIGASET